jgi:allophanate hydrolase subunit 2
MMHCWLDQMTNDALQVRPDDEIKFVQLSLEEAYTKRVYMDSLVS